MLLLHRRWRLVLALGAWNNIRPPTIEALRPRTDRACYTVDYHMRGRGRRGSLWFYTNISIGRGYSRRCCCFSNWAERVLDSIAALKTLPVIKSIKNQRVNETTTATASQTRKKRNNNNTRQMIHEQEVITVIQNAISSWPPCLFEFNRFEFIEFICKIRKPASMCRLYLMNELLIHLSSANSRKKIGSLKLETKYYLIRFKTVNNQSGIFFPNNIKSWSSIRSKNVSIMKLEFKFKLSSVWVRIQPFHTAVFYFYHEYV